MVVTGPREAVTHAIPQPLKQVVSVGIGLFIAFVAFIGFIDAGFATRIPALFSYSNVRCLPPGGVQRRVTVKPTS